MSLRSRVLGVEDDHAGPVAGAEFRTGVHANRERWIVVRSFGKYLAPDLRVALMAGDALTMGRVEAKQLVGTGWVSQFLQRLALHGLTDRACVDALKAAEETYTRRRTAFIAALADRGVSAIGRSGLNVWIPADRETDAWAAARDAGWLIAAGENFRIQSPTAVRVTISTLEEDEGQGLADVLAPVIRGAGRSGV